jgi:hypothetical protein
VQAETLHILARGDFIEQLRPALCGPAAAPTNELEHWLTTLWEQVLELKDIGIHDNFFELGGSSVQAAMLANRLQQTLGAIVSPVAFFEAPTVALLARYLVDHYAAALACDEPLNTDSLRNGEHRSPQTATPLDESRIARLRGLLRRAAPRTAHGNGSKNRRAVFILAPPRSGTTLLRVMLAGHPRMFAPPEMELLPFDTLKERRAFFGAGYEFWLQGATRAIMESKSCDGPTAERFMRDCEDAGMSVAEFYGLIQQQIANRMLVDKTPSYALDRSILERAETLFDEPLYIHLLRQPCAMIRSFEQAKLHLVGDVFFSASPECSPAELAQFIWLVSHENIQVFLQHVPVHRQHQVRFERLVKDPEPVGRDLCRFLGLEFDADMLQPYAEKRRRMTDGVSELTPMVGDPKFHRHSTIDPAVADCWQQQQTDYVLTSKTWEMAEALGYRRDGHDAERTAPSANGFLPQGSRSAAPDSFAKAETARDAGM